MPLTDTGQQPNANGATLTNVAQNAASVTLQAFNYERNGLVIFNDSTANLFIKFGITASATSFTYKVLAGGTLELPAPVYSGRVDGIWDAAGAGAARVTETF